MTTSKRKTFSPTRLLTAAIFASALTGCSASRPSSSATIDLPSIPAKFLTVTCAPTTLPSGALTKAQVEQLWARDRARLVKCGYSLGGLVGFYEDLSRRLRATEG